LRGARQAFADAREGGGSGRLPLHELGRLLTLVGYELTAEEIQWLINHAAKTGPVSRKDVDFGEFKQLEVAYREHVKAAMKKNGGCTQHDYEKCKGYFDKNSDGKHITQTALRELLSEPIANKPEETKREFQKKIGQMVKDADVDGDNQIDFDEYVELMSGLRRELDKDDFVRGVALVDEVNYNREEVSMFRDLFRTTDVDGSGFLDFDEVTTMLSNLVTIPRGGEEELKELTDKHGKGEEGLLDFWGLMRIIFDMQKVNMFGINDVIG
jgi:Ca2+-binding EF-hand superfamily protein